MGNRFLFEHYSSMVIEDYEREFANFQYLGMLTNPEGFREIERNRNPLTVEQITAGQLSQDGEEATDRIEKENEKYGIKRIDPESDEAIILE